MTWSNRHLGFEVRGCALAKDASSSPAFECTSHEVLCAGRVATTLPLSLCWSRPSRRCAKPTGKSLLYTAGFQKWSAESRPKWIPTTCLTTPTPSSFLSSHTTPPLRYSKLGIPVSYKTPWCSNLRTSRLPLTRRPHSKTHRRNQQRFAVLRLAILPEKAWSARGEGASTTNATVHANTLPLHLMASTGIAQGMKLKNTNQL